MIRIIGALSFFTIIVVTALLIIMPVFIHAYHKCTLEKQLGVNGHIIVHKTGGKFVDYEQIASQIRNVEGVTSVIPLIERKAVLLSATDIGAVQVRGISQYQLKNIKPIVSNVIFGSLDDFDKSGSLVIGARLANDLNIRVGENIDLLLPRTNSTHSKIVPKVKTYKVIAIYRMENYDSRITFMPLTEAQSFFSKDKNVDVLQIYLKNYDKVDESFDELSKIDKNISLIDWRLRNHSDHFNMIWTYGDTIKVVFFIFLLGNIVSALVMIVINKSNPAMSKNLSVIYSIFTSFNVIGTIIGIIVGLIFLISADTQNFLKNSIFSYSIYSFQSVDWMYEHVDITVIVSCLVLAFIMAFYSTWVRRKQAL